MPKALKPDLQETILVFLKDFGQENQVVKYVFIYRNYFQLGTSSLCKASAKGTILEWCSKKK